MKIYTLGRFALEVVEQPVEFPRKFPRKPVTLLKLLIALGGGGISATQVEDFLWPDNDGDAAYRSLISALARLRKILGREDAIGFTGGTLSLNPRICWVDCLCFDNLIKTSEAEENENTSSNGVAFAERAKALYHGQFLPTDEESWVLPSRAHFEKRYQFLMDGVGRQRG